MIVAAVSTNVANVAKITVAMFLHIHICIGESIRLMVPKPDLHGISQQFDEQSMGEKAANAPALTTPTYMMLGISDTSD